MGLKTFGKFVVIQSMALAFHFTSFSAAIVVVTPAAVRATFFPMQRTPFFPMQRTPLVRTPALAPLATVNEPTPTIDAAMIRNIVEVFLSAAPDRLRLPS